MKKSIVTGIILIGMLSWSNIFGQKKGPVSWEFQLRKIDNEKAELIASATMEKSWVIYSQFTEPNGPIPTEFVVEGAILQFEEKGKKITEFDAMFDVNVSKYKEKVIFTKLINLSQNNPVKGYVSFMTCDGSRCLPPADVTFELKN